MKFDEASKKKVKETEIDGQKRTLYKDKNGKNRVAVELVNPPKIEKDIDKGTYNSNVGKITDGKLKSCLEILGRRLRLMEE